MPTNKKMISPDLASFKKLSKKGNIIALAETFPADLETPVSSFLKVADKARHAFLLESAEQEEKIGRFSFLGIEPPAVYESSRNGVTITEKDATVFTAGDVVAVIAWGA